MRRRRVSKKKQRVARSVATGGGSEVLSLVQVFRVNSASTTSLSTGMFNAGDAEWKPLHFSLEACCQLTTKLTSPGCLQVRLLLPTLFSSGTVDREVRSYGPLLVGPIPRKLSGSWPPSQYIDMSVTASVPILAVDGLCWAPSPAWTCLVTVRVWYMRGRQNLKESCPSNLFILNNSCS